MLGSLKVLTFNLLAPVYKRVNIGNFRARESDDVPAYTSRQSKIINVILQMDADVVCLQEFWFNKELIQTYEDCLSHKYDFYYLQRTGNKMDGLATLTKKNLLVADVQELKMGKGDRVALLLLLSSLSSQFEEISLHRSSFIMVNTHLSFDHGAAWDKYIRNEQAKKITCFANNYCAKNYLGDISILMAGDFNGSNDCVIQHILNEDYESSFSSYFGNTKVTTHLTHNNDEIEADYIFFKSSKKRRALDSVDDEENVMTSYERRNGRGGINAMTLANSGKIENSNPKLSLTLKNCFLYPKEIDFRDWPRNVFEISDHRPLLAEFDFRTYPHLPN